MQLVGYARHMYILENHMHILKNFIQLKYYTDVYTHSYDKNADIIQWNQ